MVTMFFKGKYRKFVHCNEGWLLVDKADRASLNEHKAKPFEYWQPSPKPDHRGFVLYS